jgi:hypothetical protein
MSKWLRFCRVGAVMGALCGLGIIVLEGATARAESISITIVANGVPIAVDPLIISGATSQNYGTVDLTTLNALLVGAGSAYQFGALGGSSNWSGDPNGANLSLGGEIHILPGATGSTMLTITETEGGFASPVGPGGMLASSSGATFVGASPGDNHMASSSYNLTNVPDYAVSAKFPPSPGTDGEGTNAPLLPVGIVVSPYTLNNFISFNLALTPGGVSDAFGVSAQVTTAIPEPASMVMMAFGLPIPLLGAAWLRRRRKAEATTA